MSRRSSRRPDPHNSSINAHLATELSLKLFAPISQAGWNGGAIGPKGHDDSILSGYEIVDDARGAANAVPTIDEDGENCLHAEIEPYEDEATRDACIECGEKFRLRGSTAKADEPVEEELFYSGVATESVAAA